VSCFGAWDSFFARLSILSGRRAPGVMSDLFHVPVPDYTSNPRTKEKKHTVLCISSEHPYVSLIVPQFA
jgi:hypothetical protein